MEHHEDLHLIVVSPESTLFDGKVEIVTLPGELGSFSQVTMPHYGVPGGKMPPGTFYLQDPYYFYK